MKNDQKWRIVSTLLRRPKVAPLQVAAPPREVHRLLQRQLGGLVGPALQGLLDHTELPLPPRRGRNFKQKPLTSMVLIEFSWLFLMVLASEAAISRRKSYADPVYSVDFPASGTPRHVRGAVEARYYAPNLA